MVYLIGAGPGDEDLITMKAVKALKKCTAVMYDRLAGSGILQYINNDCQVYYCGKEPGCHYKTQDEINEMLIKLAKDGHIVGRIKGGDPYVFGRGGEEALALEKENISFEVIPGITSAISVLNYAGIPVTHRGLSQGFHVLTGRSQNKLNHKWDVLAKCDETLIFLMGFESLSMIVENLVREGKNENTPCAVVMRGTTSMQKKVIGTLANIEEIVKKAEISSPCIIVVGDVVSLNDKLNWFEKKELFGANVCITRSKKQNLEIKDQLKDLGAQVKEIDSIEIKDNSINLENYIDKLEEYSNIILTSINSVNMFFDYLIKKSYDIRRLKASFSCVGKTTESALKSRGINAKYVAKDFSAQGLLDIIKCDLKTNDKILFPCSNGAKNLLEDNLKDKVSVFDRVDIYETALGEGGDIRDFDKVNIVVFMSPSSVKNTIKLVGVNNLNNKQIISIGPSTLKELEANNLNAVSVEEHNSNGIIKEIKKIWRGKNA